MMTAVAIKKCCMSIARSGLAKSGIFRYSMTYIP
jgi:hypothetical protein